MIRIFAPKTLWNFCAQNENSGNSPIDQNPINGQKVESCPSVHYVFIRCQYIQQFCQKTIDKTVSLAFIECQINTTSLYSVVIYLNDGLIKQSLTFVMCDVFMELKPNSAVLTPYSP